MKTERQNSITSTLIIFLLLVQVVLSVLIVRRLNNNDQTLSNIDQKISLLVEPQQPEVPIHVEGVSVDDDPWKGTEGAPVTIVEFADYQCPACAQAELNVEQLLSEYEGQILFVLRDFPLEGHPHALKAAEAANCAGDQGKYWQMHDLLFDNQNFLDENNLRSYAASLGLEAQQFTTCLEEGKYTDEVLHDLEQGIEYQVNGTPTFFVNGYRVLGGGAAVSAYGN